MPALDTNHETLALQALVFILGDDSRAARLLDLTGLTPDQLRATAGTQATLVATLTFLESHEPDLVACADALGVAPETLVAARRGLETA